MRTMVFPAPVSPVIAVRPGPSGSRAAAMTPRFSMRISSNTSSLLRASAPAGDGQGELADESVGERRGAQPGEPDGHGRAAHLDACPDGKLEAARAVGAERACGRGRARI